MFRVVLVPWVIAAAVVLSPGGSFGDPPVSDRSKSPQSKSPQSIGPAETTGVLIRGKPPQHWIDELASDTYARRERAAMLLAQSADQVLDELAQATLRGDFELTTQAISILQQRALLQPPDESAGAIGKLNEIATDGASSRATSARLAIDNVLRLRSSQAIQLLSEAGVFIGEGMIDPALYQATRLIRVDEAFAGDHRSLQWLRWVRGIPTLMLRGPDIVDAALPNVAEMDDIRNLYLVDGSVSLDALRAIGSMKRIESLTMNYIELPPGAAEVIAELPLQGSLVMCGTILEPDDLEFVELSLPAVTIDYRLGGFLGVESDVQAGNCAIQNVISGSAAEAAGILPGDVIIRANGQPIKDFSALRDEIGKLQVGQPLKLTIDRQGVTLEKTANLMRKSI